VRIAKAVAIRQTTRPIRRPKLSQAFCATHNYGKETTTEKTMPNLSNAHRSDPQRAPEEFPAPIGKLLGLMLLQQENGHAIIEFNADQRYANPMGTLHGGVLCDLADAAMGGAYRSALAEGETFTTIELKINFLRPIWRAKLRAEARIVRAGKLLGLVECDIFDDQRRLVARASSTCMILRGENANGRQLPSELHPRFEAAAG
jgi:uncharacterized protein (TIGR00369 family)